MQAELTGVSASPGIVVGPAHLLRWEVPDVDARVLLDGEIDSEIARHFCNKVRLRRACAAGIDGDRQKEEGGKKRSPHQARFQKLWSRSTRPSFGTAIDAGSNEARCWMSASARIGRPTR